MFGLLDAYQFDPDPAGYQINYEPMMRRFLADVVSLDQLRTYKFALGEKPSSVDECDAWIITGSPKSAYDDDPWIGDLAQFTRDAVLARKKLVGVCFGHQLIAHALGGKTEKSPKGWGVGVRRFPVLRHAPWMEPKEKECALIFSHQDQVTKLPENAELLASDDFCPVQMYRIGDHVFCYQGHPEFTPEFAKARLDTRIERVGRATYEAAVKSLREATSRDTFARWLNKFLYS